MTDEAERQRLIVKHRSLTYDLRNLKEEYRAASEIYARKLEALIRATERINEQLRALGVDLSTWPREEADDADV